VYFISKSLVKEQMNWSICILRSSYNTKW
jgi:hypothetical protein